MIRAQVALLVASIPVTSHVFAAVPMTDGQLSLIVAGTGNGNGNGNVGTNNGNGNNGNNNGNGNVGDNKGNNNPGDNRGNGNGASNPSNFNAAATPVTSAAVTPEIGSPALATISPFAAAAVQPSVVGALPFAPPVAGIPGVIDANQLGVLLGAGGYAGAPLAVPH